MKRLRYTKYKDILKSSYVLGINNVYHVEIDLTNYPLSVIIKQNDEELVYKNETYDVDSAKKIAKKALVEQFGVVFDDELRGRKFQY